MGISNEAFKKMVVSNMMYDLNLNGFTYTPENIQKVIGKGFIPSAIQYNKRAYQTEDAIIYSKEIKHLLQWSILLRI